MTPSAMRKILNKDIFGPFFGFLTGIILTPQSARVKPEKHPKDRFCTKSDAQKVRGEPVLRDRKTKNDLIFSQMGAKQSKNVQTLF